MFLAGNIKNAGFSPKPGKIVVAQREKYLTLINTQAYRGVDTYIDPGSNRAVELPSGYGNVWTNGSEYILSDSPGYNPNVGSNVVWQEMNRKR